MLPLVGLWVALVPQWKVARFGRLTYLGLSGVVYLTASCIHCGKNCGQCQAKSKVRKIKMRHYQFPNPFLINSVPQIPLRVDPEPAGLSS